MAQKENGEKADWRLLQVIQMGDSGDLGHNGSSRDGKK